MNFISRTRFWSSLILVSLATLLLHINRVHSQNFTDPWNLEIKTAYKLDRNGMSLKEICTALNIPYPPPDLRIVIGKVDHELDIYSGNIKIKTHSIRLGYKGKIEEDKMVREDSRTAEGVFYPVTRFKRPDKTTNYYGAIGVSYPNLEDGISGYINKVIDSKLVERIATTVVKRQTGDAWRKNGLWAATPLGGNIAIHGARNISPDSNDGNDYLGGSIQDTANLSLVDWTNGCIYLSNQYMDELRELITEDNLKKVPILIVKEKAEIECGELKDKFDLFLEDPEPFITLGTLKDLVIPPELKLPEEVYEAAREIDSKMKERVSTVSSDLSN